jgi:hypothetical protein
VDHFLDSVQILKKSVEYDLTFTEALINKGNYALANIELPQLEMVVSPNNPRLKDIAKALASPQAQDHIAKAAKRIPGQYGSGHNRNDDRKAYEKEMASLVTLVKDGVEYQVKSGRVEIGTYPVFSGAEINRWRLQTMDALTNAPTGWEKPGFDDSTWKDTPKKNKPWPEEPVMLMRTNFEVTNVEELKSLRVRLMIGKKRSRNLTLYLNGNLVARATNLPRCDRIGMDFDLNPGALALLKKGNNTLALSTQHGPENNHGLSIRLEGILKVPSDSKPEPSKKPEISKKAEPAKKPEPPKKAEPAKKPEISKKADPAKKPEPAKKTGKTK